MSKISSGYLLTPHRKMGPKRAKENANQEFDEEAFQELLNCPEKKKRVLQLLSDNKHIIAKHREIEMNSPVKKLKQKRNLLESAITFYRLFKNGCYQTYQKAKLLKVYLVSIVWIEFCWRTLQRQKERLYSALKLTFGNESILRSQLEKEYEEIVQGTPLPTTVSAIDCSTSDSFKTAEEFNYDANKKKSKKKVKKKLPTIVCTKLRSDDVQLFAQVVKKLGRFVLEDEVSERTTHLVAGRTTRTINMLRAISRGCWVVKFEWVLQSLENGKWLPEENFELTDFSSAVQKCRLERQAFGSNYTLDVFETTPPIYVAPSTIPRCSDLKELITTCKGKVVSAARMAKIVVGQYVKQDETKCVNETWILDCITFYPQKQFTENYLL